MGLSNSCQNTADTKVFIPDNIVELSPMADKTPSPVESRLPFFKVPTSAPVEVMDSAQRDDEEPCNLSPGAGSVGKTPVRGNGVSAAWERTPKSAVCEKSPGVFFSPSGESDVLRLDISDDDLIGESPARSALHEVSESDEEIRELREELLKGRKSTDQITSSAEEELLGGDDDDEGADVDSQTEEMLLESSDDEELQRAAGTEEKPPNGWGAEVKSVGGKPLGVKDMKNMDEALRRAAGTEEKSSRDGEAELKSVGGKPLGVKDMKNMNEALRRAAGTEEKPPNGWGAELKSVGGKPLGVKDMKNMDEALRRAAGTEEKSSRDGDAELKSVGEEPDRMKDKEDESADWTGEDVFRLTEDGNFMVFSDHSSDGDEEEFEEEVQIVFVKELRGAALTGLEPVGRGNEELTQITGLAEETKLTNQLNQSDVHQTDRDPSQTESSHVEDGIVGDTHSLTESASSQNVVDNSQTECNQNVEDRLVDDPHSPTDSAISQTVVDDSQTEFSRNFEDRLVDDSRSPTDSAIGHTVVDDSQTEFSQSVEDRLVDDSRSPTDSAIGQTVVDDCQTEFSRSVEGRLVDDPHSLTESATSVVDTIHIQTESSQNVEDRIVDDPHSLTESCAISPKAEDTFHSQTESEQEDGVLSIHFSSPNVFDCSSQIQGGFSVRSEVWSSPGGDVANLLDCSDLPSSPANKFSGNSPANKLPGYSFGNRRVRLMRSVVSPGRPIQPLVSPVRPIQPLVSPVRPIQPLVSPVRAPLLPTPLLPPSPQFTEHLTIPMTNHQNSLLRHFSQQVPLFDYGDLPIATSSPGRFGANQFNHEFSGSLGGGDPWASNSAWVERDAWDHVGNVPMIVDHQLSSPSWNQPLQNWQQLDQGSGSAAPVRFDAQFGGQTVPQPDFREDVSLDGSDFVAFKYCRETDIMKPDEIEDNNDPRWATLKKQTTDAERCASLRERWGNPNVPDPKKDLTTHNYLRRNRARDPQLYQGTESSLLQHGRKRCASSAPTDERPGKRLRTLLDSKFADADRKAQQEMERLNSERLAELTKVEHKREQEMDLVKAFGGNFPHESFFDDIEDRAARERDNISFIYEGKIRDVFNRNVKVVNALRKSLDDMDAFYQFYGTDYHVTLTAEEQRIYDEQEQMFSMYDSFYSG